MTDTRHAEPSVPDRERPGAFGRLLAIPTSAIFAVSLLLAVVVLYATGVLDGVVDAVSRADVLMLTLAAPIYVASLWVLAFRWHMLVEMAGGSSNLPKAAEAFLTSVIINYAAPIGLAVPSRAALTKRALGLDAGQTGTIALWEIGFDVAVLGTGSLLWMLTSDGAPTAVSDEIADSSTSYLLAGLALVVFAVAIGIVALRRPGLRRKLTEIGRTILIAPTRRPAEAGRTLAVSVIYWVLQAVVLWMLITALGVTVSAQFMLGFTSLPILVGMLSPIPGGAAVREGLMYVVARLSGFHAEADAILAAALIYRFALFAAIPILYGLNRIWLNAQSNGSADTLDAIDHERNSSG